MRRQDAIVSDLRKWCNSDVCTAEIAMGGTLQLGLRRVAKTLLEEWRDEILIVGGK